MSADLLTNACLNPAFKVLPTELPAPERLAYWLKNPLLWKEHPGRMKATAERAAGFTTNEEREALITRLEAARLPLRWKFSRFDDDAPTDWQMQHLFSHELINGKERTALTRYRKDLAVQEWQWLKDHVEAVLKVRQEALELQRELWASQQTLDFNDEEIAA